MMWRDRGGVGYRRQNREAGYHITSEEVESRQVVQKAALYSVAGNARPCLAIENVFLCLYDAASFLR